jgi:hypothetical protein
MKVWIASFLVLFAIAELYQWAKHFTLPLPVYILGGAFLAIASNYEGWASLPFPATEKQSEAIAPPAAPQDTPSQFPPTPATGRSTPSISFTIERPNSHPTE